MILKFLPPLYFVAVHSSLGPALIAWEYLNKCLWFCVIFGTFLVCVPTPSIVRGFLPVAIDMNRWLQVCTIISIYQNNNFNSPAIFV